MNLTDDTSSGAAVLGAAAVSANTGAAPRRPRADALRNMAKLLRAAEEVFSEEGLSAPVDEVAQRAGLGVGTVYRHFPTKEALVRAIVEARFEQAARRAEELCEAGDPGEALGTFLGELVELSYEKRDFSEELVRAGIDIERWKPELMAHLREAFGLLLDKAQRSGAVRPDITVDDLDALGRGTCLAACQCEGRAARERLVAVVVDGLRIRPA